MNFFKNILFLLFVSFFISCASQKSDIIEADLKQILQKVSEIRISLQLQDQIQDSFLNDYQIFVRACETYGINVKSALDFLEKKKPALFDYLTSLKNELYQ